MSPQLPARLVWIQKASSEASVTGVSLSRITLYLFFYYCCCQSNYFCLLSSITFLSHRPCQVSRSSRANATVARCTSHKHFSSPSSTLDLGFSPFPVFSGNILVHPPSSDLVSQVTNIFLLLLQPWILVFLSFQFSQEIFQFILHPPRLHKPQTFSPPSSTLVLSTSPVRTLFFSRPSDWR